MKNLNKEIIAFLAISLGLTGILMAATSVNLGSLNSFAIVGGSTITNTGPSIINGDLGLSPGTSVTGFPPGVINGATHVANTSAVQAQNDLTTAYTSSSQTPVLTVPSELGGTTLTSGVYDSADGTFMITGSLTLNAEGNPDAVFIFKTASTLITAGASNVVLINGAQACNVFWQVGSSATLGANSTFKGNLFALTSITLTTGANVEGRILARNGAVTLDTNTITRATCTVPPIIVTPVATTTVATTTTATTTLPVVLTSTTTIQVIPVATTTILLATTTPIVNYSAPTFPNAGIAPSDIWMNSALLMSILLIIAIGLFSLHRRIKLV